MSTLKTHNLQSPDAGSVNISLSPNAGMVVAGVSTFAQAAGAVTVPAGGDIRIANSGGWTGEYGGKIQQYLNFLYIQGGSNGIRFRYTDGNDRWVIGSGGHFDPGAAGSYDIGNTGNRVRQIYSTNVNVSGVSTFSGLVNVNVSASQSTSTPLLLQNSAAAGTLSNPEIVKLGFGSQGIVKASIRADVYGNGNLTFHTNNDSEKLRITSDGKLLLGRTTLSHTSSTMEIQGTSEAYLRISPNTNTGTAGVVFGTADDHSTGGIYFNGSDDSLVLAGHNNDERMRIDSSGRVVIGGSSSYIGGAALAVLGTGTTPNTYGSFAIGKVGANPTAGTTLANIRLNGGSIGTRRGAEINAIANSNWSDGSSHPTKLTFAVANVNSASATQRFEINHYGHMVFTNENVFASSSSPGTNGFKGLTQLGYQHWGQRQYYSGQQNLTQNGYFDLFSNNTNHDDIIFWLNIKGFHGNRTFGTAHGAIGGYGLSVSYQSASGMYGTFSGVDVSGTGGARRKLRWTSTSPYTANWWIWGWISGTSLLTTHTGYTAAQLH